MPGRCQASVFNLSHPVTYCIAPHQIPSQKLKRTLMYRHLKQAKLMSSNLFHGSQEAACEAEDACEAEAACVADDAKGQQIRNPNSSVDQPDLGDSSSDNTDTTQKKQETIPLGQQSTGGGWKKSDKIGNLKRPHTTMVRVGTARRANYGKNKDNTKTDHRTARKGNNGGERHLGSANRRR